MTDTIPSERAPEPMLRNELLTFGPMHLGIREDVDVLSSPAPAAIVARRIVVPKDIDPGVSIARVQVGERVAFEGELSCELIHLLKLRVPMREGDQLQITFRNTWGCAVLVRGAVLGRRARPPGRPLR